MSAHILRCKWRVYYTQEAVKEIFDLNEPTGYTSAAVWGGEDGAADGAIVARARQALNQARGELKVKNAYRAFKQSLDLREQQLREDPGHNFIFQRVKRCVERLDLLLRANGSSSSRQARST